MNIIYRITDPNWKIYADQGRTKIINNFGSASDEIIAQDFSQEQGQRFTTTRDILWQSEIATRQEVNQMEIEWIAGLRSNDPATG